MPIVHARSVLAPLAFSSLSSFAVLLAACGAAPTPAPSDATSITASHDTKAVTPGGASLLTPSGTAGSQKAERRTSSAWAPCHASFKLDANADVTSSVDQLAKGCADTTKMHFIDSWKGTQAAANAPQSFHFKADGGHCYRAYAVASSTIQDLDLLMKDSTGALAGEDSTDDPTPVVLEDGAVCFKSADDAMVIVSIGAGGGAYAVQLWGD